MRVQLRAIGMRGRQGGEMLGAGKGARQEGGFNIHSDVSFLRSLFCDPRPVTNVTTRIRRMVQLTKP